MTANLAQLRSQVELALAGRVSSPFTLRDFRVEHVASGISEIDALAGGLPRGSLIEVFGPSCSGRTSLLFSALGARTTEAEACALIDGCDAFDPHSAEAAGIDLKQLLWVRCQNLEQSFRATDFILQAGGFGFIALDLSDVSHELVHRVPLDTWFRFRRAIEGTSTILLVLGQESHAKTCASLVLQMEAEKSLWKSTLSPDIADLCRHSFSRLVNGSDIRAEMVRARNHRGFKTGFQDEGELRKRNDRTVVFETREIWGF